MSDFQKLALTFNKVASLVNSARGMNCVYRIVLQGTEYAKQGDKNPLRMTIIVNVDGSYVKHYWG